MAWPAGARATIAPAVGAAYPARVTETPGMPEWAEEIRNVYLRGEASLFVLHGNVFDHFLDGDRLRPMGAYLDQVVLQRKQAVCRYNPAGGLSVLRAEPALTELREVEGTHALGPVLSSLERVLKRRDGVSVIIDYAEMVAPAGDASLLSDKDRRSIVTLHRWSLDPVLAASDNLVLLVTENLGELSPKLLANPRVWPVRVPLPDDAARSAAIACIDPSWGATDRARWTRLSAGLKNVQLLGILRPTVAPDADIDERYAHILRLLEGQPDAEPRARKLAELTQGEPLDALAALLRPGAPLYETDGDDERLREVSALLLQKKRAILEKECAGLVEFVAPDHSLDDVGGMEQAKAELRQVAGHLRSGDRSRVPMGMLFVGPMGTGKTFLAEAFAASSGLTAIKLKNFRSKWVGATEANLERILSVVKAIGQVLLIIDEGDRAFGRAADGEGDGGTSSRVMARLKEFMSDPQNRGRVLFLVMSNRPDKLDVDLKRAGRLDRKIPFFYPQAAEDVEPVLLAVLKRHGVAHGLAFPTHRESVSLRLVDYSNADIEGVALAAHDLADGRPVSPEDMVAAIDDYLPARDQAMLAYMELLAVFESSSRRFLPARYRDLSAEELQTRLRALRQQVRG